MKVLCVSDIHYSLKQFDWLAQHCEGYDLVVLAGDLMELGSYVDPDTQAAVVEQYFRRICAKVPVVACSGNHDLVDDGDGDRSAEWLEDLSIPNLVVDYGRYDSEQICILSLPWWEGDDERARLGEWLEKHYGEERSKPVIWVYHAPPLGTKTSWNGKRDLGDAAIVEWIKAYSPALVMSGHIHNAPYYPEGSWMDRIGSTIITNGGRQTGEAPATIVLELESGSITWCGMEGCEEREIAIS